MLPRERLEIIKQIAIEEKKLYVSKLSKKFNVTDETIRRDISKLEEQGVVIKTYGGAILNIEKLSEKKLADNNITINLEENMNIAQKAAEVIKENTTIVADCSLLVLDALKAMSARNDVTVITNSIRVLQVLSQSNLNIISSGGLVNSKAPSLQGSITQNTIKNYNVDIALITCDGMDINKGILDSDEAEAEIKKNMIKQANEVVLLVDSCKFHKTSLIKLFDYKDVDYIITDKKPEEEWIKIFESYNIKIIY